MLIDVLRTRRSVRKYTTQAIEKEKLDILMEATLRSPSAVDRKPWEFVFVTDPELLGRLAQAKPTGASFVKDAPLAVVVCAHAEKSDVWVEDTSIATLILHLVAADLGLGSCWIQIRLRDHGDGRSAQEYVSELLGLHKGMTVEAVVAIGYPAESKSGHPASSLSRDRIHMDRYARTAP